MMFRANGASHNVELSGRDNDGTVIFIHGIGADLRLWEEVVPYFEGKYRVIAYDLRGSGKSEFPSSARLSVGLWADDLDSLMTALKVKSAHLVGWSLGGMIAMEMYFKSPKKVTSLIPVGSTPKLQPAAAELFRQRAKLAESEGMKTLVEKTFQTTEAAFAPSARSEHPEKVRKFRAMLENHNKDSYAAIARAIAEVDQTSRMSEILAPTLIIVGQYDARTPLQDSEMMCMQIANSYMKIIPDCGHFYPMEKPEALSNIILDYLESLAEL